MVCTYKDKQVQEFNYVALLGFGNTVHEFGLYSNQQLDTTDFEVIRKIPVKNKCEAISILSELREGFDVEPIGYTHEDRVNVATNIADKMRHLDYIDSVHLVGSVAVNNDNEYSDIDLVVIRHYCPDEENCPIQKLEDSEKEYVDIYCLSKEKIENEPELLEESVKI